MKRKNTLSIQMKKRAMSENIKKPNHEGNTEVMISTGSTLLDLAISGGRKKGGGLPGGILVEVFGPSGCGKTVILCEIAGAIQRKKGEIKFNDPEARLNKQFAKIFDLEIKDEDYDTPDTVTQVFQTIRKWEPNNPKIINGVVADSLAALSTNLEMEKDEGDKMGMRRAKEFSEELRKTCRILTERNLLLVCSNQVRVNTDAGPYGQKYVSPGGESIGFYSSLRLRAMSTEKIKKEQKIAGKTTKRVIGVRTVFEVFKSSLDKPYRTAPVTILFDYGIDDIRENLQFIKQNTSNSTYTVNGESAGRSMEDAIGFVEEKGLEEDLKQEVICLWEEIEKKFESIRKTKKR